MGDAFEDEAFVYRRCICSTAHSKGIGALFIPASPASTHDAFTCVMLQKIKNYTRLDAVRQQRCSLPTEWLNFGGFVLHESQVFPADGISALCGTYCLHQGSCQCTADLGLLAEPLYRGVQLGRVCLRGGNEDVHPQVSQQGGAVDSEMHIMKAQHIFFPVLWNIQFSKQDVSWWSYPKQCWDFLLFIFPQKEGREPWVYHCAVYLFSYFPLVLLVFSFPQGSCPHFLVAAQSCAPLISTLRMRPCVLSSLTFVSPEWGMWVFRLAIFWIVSLVNSWRA